MSERPEGLLTAVEAAELVGMTPWAFRKAVERQEELQGARMKITATLSLYEREKVLRWAMTRRTRKTS